MGLTLEQLYNAAYAWHLEAPRSGGSQQVTWHVSYMVLERSYQVHMVLAYTDYRGGEPRFDTLVKTVTYDEITEQMDERFSVRDVLNARLLGLFEQAGIEPPNVLGP